MRIVLLIAALVLFAGTAQADRKLVARNAGRIVISPDPIPSEATELAHFVDANLAKDGRYTLIKGPPWAINLVGFLAKAPGKQPVQLVFTDASDPKLPPIASIEVTPHERVLTTTVTATTAAGFANAKTYVVRLIAGKTVLARCELTLRDI